MGGFSLNFYINPIYFWSITTSQNTDWEALKRRIHHEFGGRINIDEWFVYPDISPMKNVLSFYIFSPFFFSLFVATRVYICVIFKFFFSFELYTFRLPSRPFSGSVFDLFSYGQKIRPFCKERVTIETSKFT